MKETPGSQVHSLLSRANESLEEAKVLGSVGHWNPCFSRLYYSCFFAASALLEKYGLSSEKHSRVRSLFNAHFARTKKVSRDVAAIYDRLFVRRRERNQSPFFAFNGADVEPWLREVDTFVNTMSRLAD